MRKAVVGLLAIIVGVPAGLLGDHFVTGAPSWVWAVIATVVVVGGVLMALLSDPIFHRLAPYGRRHTVVVTLLVFVVCGTLGALAWHLMLRWEDTDGQLDKQATTSDTRMPVRLEWHREGTALSVAVINVGTDTVRDASLSVIDIRKRSDAGVFVEVPAFHMNGPFIETALGLPGSEFESAPLLPNVPTIAPFLRLDDGTHIFGNKTGRLFFFRITDDDILQLISIPEPGIWRATFKVNGNAKLDNDVAELFFQWVGQDHAAMPWLGN